MTKGVAFLVDLLKKEPGLDNAGLRAAAAKAGHKVNGRALGSARKLVAEPVVPVPVTKVAEAPKVEKTAKKRGKGRGIASVYDRTHTTLSTAVTPTTWSSSVNVTGSIKVQIETVRSALNGLENALNLMQVSIG